MVTSSIATTSLWIVFPKRQPEARLRLFCLPYAGVGASAFHAWGKLLPAEIEVCSVQLPGRESRLREAPYTQLASLVEALAQELLPYLDRPFALFGHSLGALTAYELARQLRRIGGLAPRHLLVSGRRAPHWPERDTPLHPLPREEFIAGVQQRYNALPDVIQQDPELVDLFLPTLRADITIFETYQYTAEPALACPLAAFGGRADTRVSVASLAAWHQHTSAAFTMELFEGGHFYLQPHRAQLLQTLMNTLEQHLTS